VHAENNWSTNWQGIDGDYFPVNDWQLALGDGFSARDYSSAAKVVVLGETVRRELFGTDDPVGATVRLGRVPLRVVGVLAGKAGTARGIEGILVATAVDTPEAIRPTVVRFARRLAYEPIEQALPDLAAELDHEVGDLVVTALEIAAAAGGRQIRSVLDDLARAAREQAGALRRQEVARERPRSEMRQVAVIAAGTVVVLSIAGGEYLAPYRTAAGQLVLVIVAAIWGLGFHAMARLARPDPVERYLVTSVERPGSRR
jgi:hypothetical protein